MFRIMKEEKQFNPSYLEFKTHTKENSERVNEK